MLQDEVYEAHPSVYLPLLCVANYLRHHLTKSALEDHLFNVRLASHSNVKELSSQHNLLRKYSHLRSEVTKIVVCPSKKCPSVLTMKQDNPEEIQLNSLVITNLSKVCIDHVSFCECQSRSNWCILSSTTALNYKKWIPTTEEIYILANATKS